MPPHMTRMRFLLSGISRLASVDSPSATLACSTYRCFRTGSAPERAEKTSSPRDRMAEPHRTMTSKWWLVCADVMGLGGGSRRND